MRGEAAPVLVTASTNAQLGLRIACPDAGDQAEGEQEPHDPGRDRRAQRAERRDAETAVDEHEVEPDIGDVGDDDRDRNRLRASDGFEEHAGDQRHERGGRCDGEGHDDGKGGGDELRSLLHGATPQQQPPSGGAGDRGERAEPQSEGHRVPPDRAGLLRPACSLCVGDEHHAGGEKRDEDVDHTPHGAFGQSEHRKFAGAMAGHHQPIGDAHAGEACA